MKNFKRKYEFETNVPVPGIEEIMKVAANFSEPQENGNKAEPEMNKSKIQASPSPKFDKGMSSIRSQMMVLAEAVAEDEVGARRQKELSKTQQEAVEQPVEEMVQSEKEDKKEINTEKSESPET